MAGLTPIEKAMIQEMYAGYKEQKPLIDQLMPVVFGNEKAGFKGLVKDNEANKDAIKQYKNDRIIAISVSTILGGIGAYFAKFFH